MGTAATLTRDHRTITVDLQNEAIYFRLIADGKAFLECVLACMMSLGFQLKHKATCSGGGCLTRHSHYVRVRLGGLTIWRIQCTMCKAVFTVLPHFVLRYRQMRPEVARDALLVTHGGMSLELCAVICHISPMAIGWNVGGCAPEGPALQCLAHVLYVPWVSRPWKLLSAALQADMELLMTSVLTPTGSIETLADLLDQLGGIAPERVRFRPLPGPATEQDVLDVRARTGRLCELVDGVLVEKGMGFRESLLAIALSTILSNFVKPRNLGLVTGEAGMMRLAAGLVRIPDVAFIAWDRLPNRQVPREPIPDLAPDLVVEVLSASNTLGEMARKRQEYFAAGVQLVWFVDPEARTVEVFTAPEQSAILHEEDTLEGGVVFPGFMLPLRDFFAELDRQGHG